jgi:hypothetical protein
MLAKWNGLETMGPLLKDAFLEKSHPQRPHGVDEPIENALETSPDCNNPPGYPNSKPSILR